MHVCYESTQGQLVASPSSLRAKQDRAREYPALWYVLDDVARMLDSYYRG